MTESPGTKEYPALTVDEPSVPPLTGWFARRRTVRNFDPDAEIPDGKIEELIDAGRKAPTSGTIQMYSFIWIRDEQTRAKIHELCGGNQPQVEESSHFLLVCIDFRRVRKLYKHRDLDFEMTPITGLLKGAVDASLAAQGVITVAESQGYGVCPIGAIGKRLAEVTQEVNLPTEVLPIWGLCIGEPLDIDSEQKTPRVPLQAVLHDEEYVEPSYELLEECYQKMNERYDPESGRVWEGTLANYWTPAPAGSMNAQQSQLLKAMCQQGFFAYQGIHKNRTSPDARE